MVKKLIVALAFALALIATPSAHAASITYSIDLNVGTDVLTGTITTDGTIGQLAAGDITGYSLSDSLNILGTTLTTTNSLLTPSTTSTLIPLTGSLTGLTFATSGTSLQISPIAGNSSLTIFSGAATDFIRIDAPACAPSSCPNGHAASIGAVPETSTASGIIEGALMVGAVLILRRRRAA
jgi:hypothetical protein